MYLSLRELKTQMEAAKAMNEKVEFSATLRNKERDIKIVMEYSPFKDKRNDLYPYFYIQLIEEE